MFQVFCQPFCFFFLSLFTTNTPRGIFLVALLPNILFCQRLTQQRRCLEHINRTSTKDVTSDSPIKVLMALKHSNSVVKPTIFSQTTSSPSLKTSQPNLLSPNNLPLTIKGDSLLAAHCLVQLSRENGENSASANTNSVKQKG